MSGNKPALNSVHLKYRKIHTSDLKYDDKVSIADSLSLCSLASLPQFLERGTYGDVRKATWQERSVAVKMFSCAERKGGFSEEVNLSLPLPLLPLTLSNSSCVSQCSTNTPT